MNYKNNNKKTTKSLTSTKNSMNATILPLHHIPPKPYLKRAVQIRQSRIYIKKLDPLLLFSFFLIENFMR